MEKAIVPRAESHALGRCSTRHWNKLRRAAKAAKATFATAVSGAEGAQEDSLASKEARKIEDPQEIGKPKTKIFERTKTGRLHVSGRPKACVQAEQGRIEKRKIEEPAFERQKCGQGR